MKLPNIDDMDGDAMRIPQRIEVCKCSICGKDRIYVYHYSKLWVNYLIHADGWKSVKDDTGKTIWTCESCRSM